MRSDDISVLHRIRQDEVWHFYAGSPLTIHAIDSSGVASATFLGCDLMAGQQPLAVIPAGVWFGATVDRPNTYALVGCTVAPGFDFADFEMANRQRLVAQFPRHQSLIERLTRESEAGV